MPTTIKKPDFTFIDLFAGIGGFYIGMSSVGGKCVFTNEWDKYAATTYKAWTGNGKIETQDIRTINYNDIPSHDVLCGGFPCQPFSLAGKKLGFEDERQGNLFWAITEIVKTKKPPVLFLENVKNLKSHDKGNTWRVIHETLQGLNYHVYDQVIDAKYWVPQHRERIFIVCFDKEQFTEEEIASFAFPQTSGKVPPKLSSILEKNPDPKYMLSDKLWSYLQRHAERHAAKGNGFGYGLADRNGISRTISARYYKDGSEILIQEEDWENPRKLTPSEAIKLMGFAKRFSKLIGHKEQFPQVVSDTQMYKQCGNSVSPLVVEAIGSHIVEVLAARKKRLNI